MKGKSKIIAIILCMALVFGLAFGLVGCGGSKNPPVDPPAPVYKVHSVTLQYNDKNIDGGILNVDVSAKTVQLTAKVEKDEKADGTVKFASSEESVASVDGKGLVTLKKEGETVVSATAGEKKHEIVLVVGDDYTAAESYSITVNGGTASATKAEPGSHITLTAAVPEHKDFIKWTFDAGEEDLWVNGNVFRMPAHDVVVTAEYEDMLYTLNVVGATVTAAGAVQDPEGEEGGNTEGGAAPEFDMTVYKFSYETDISVEAIEAPEGKMFVGWDYGSVNNRVGEMGDPEYGPFSMPDSTLTVWAVFSDLTTKVLTAGSVGSYGDSGKGACLITDGAPEGDFKDPDFGGLSGFRMAIPATEGASADYPENIQGSEFDTSSGGSHTLKAVFKNHHETLSVTVELYLTYYGARVSTGNVTVGPGETVTKFFSAGLGINDPWWGFAVREDIGGSAGDVVLLDMVLGAAPTYPNGDKLLQVSGNAEYVHLGAYSNCGTTWEGRRPMLVDNNLGLSSIAIYGGNFKNTPNAYISAPIQNMPEYDPENPVTTVYLKVVNNVTNQTEPTGTFAFAVGRDNNPIDGVVGEQFDREDIVITKVGEVFILKLEIPRTADDGGKYYFSIIKPKIDVNDAYWGHNFSLQMTYNNVMGYEEA